jgi:hypothetical protein
MKLRDIKMLPTRKPPQEELEEPVQVQVSPEQLRQMWELVRREDRLLVFALTPLLQYVNRPDDLEPRLKYAIDMMVIAAAERISRNCKKDLEDDQAS